MPDTYAGAIGLGLYINENQYNRQLAGIEKKASKSGKQIASKFNNSLGSVQKMAGKVAGALAAAFTVKKIIEFGKECVDLGSDLAEVQNVVDVTFPSMKKRVDEFAQSAAGSFGLSETMAKKFTGTFGSMAEAFGFTESQAYDMSTALTGLAGDVASFYNISQDEAYTKLKSVFSGETETLKDLGVVMTQTALDAYALANGYGKTTKAMSEAEKVSLRFAFVQDQLSNASGDFNRTSDSWANQVRILKLEFESFKATIGQGLINIFLPVIKTLNSLIAKLQVAAKSFKSFTEMLSGKSTSQIASAGAVAGETLSAASESASNLADNTESAGKAAANTAKKMKALMGFDVINKMDSTDEQSSSSTGGTGTTTDAIGTNANVLDQTSDSCDKLQKKVEKLKELFIKGFTLGLGDTEKNLETVHASVQSIHNSLNDIFTSKELQKAAGYFTTTMVESFGKLVGSFTSIGVSIATNLTSGIAKSLEENKQFITDKLSSILTISADMWKITSDCGVAIADIIDNVLTSDVAVTITSDIVSIFTQAFLGTADLFGKIGLDIIDFICTPIIDNKDKISDAITNTLSPISTIMSTVKTAVTDAFAIIGKTYDEHIHPMFMTFKKGFSDTFGKLLDVYNTYFAPVMDSVAKKFEDIYEPHIKPVLEKLGALIGTIADAISALYKNVLKPIVDWFIETILPILAPIAETFGSIFVDTFARICDAVGGLFDIMNGLLTFLTGVFTGDWSKCCEGLQTTFSGAVSVIKALFSPIVSFFTDKVAGIKNAFSDIPGWFRQKFTSASNFVTGAFSNIGSFFGNLASTIRGKFTHIGSEIGSAVSGAFKSSMNFVFSLVEDKVNGFIGGINSAIRLINKIPGVSIGRIPRLYIPKLAQGGYVKPNTPQLAMIGDNRHQGEVVAPENKLIEMARKAAELSNGGGSSSEVVSLLRQILAILQSFDIEIIMDGDKVTKKIVNRINDITLSTGTCPVKA